MLNLLSPISSSMRTRSFRKVDASVAGWSSRTRRTSPTSSSEMLVYSSAFGKVARSVVLSPPANG